MPISRPLGNKEQLHMGRVLDYMTMIVKGKEIKAEEKNFIWRTLLKRGQ